jgi:hypothetical protein
MDMQPAKKASRTKPDLAWLIWVLFVFAICSALFGPMLFTK